MKKTIYILVFTIITAGSVFTFSACNNQPAKTDAKAPTSDTNKVAMAKYACPMCTDVVQDSMGKCPKCGMDLEKVTDKKQDSTKK